MTRSRTLGVRKFAAKRSKVKIRNLGTRRFQIMFKSHRKMHKAKCNITQTLLNNLIQYQLSITVQGRRDRFVDT